MDIGIKAKNPVNDANQITGSRKCILENENK